LACSEKFRTDTRSETWTSGDIFKWSNHQSGSDTSSQQEHWLFFLENPLSGSRV